MNSGGNQKFQSAGRGHRLAGLLLGMLLVGTSAWGQGQVGAVNYATPYTFVTIAGSSTNSGNVDGTNGFAQFNAPQQLTMDTNGNLYTVDANEQTVRKIAPLGANWMVTTIAGTAPVIGSQDGTNGSAQFNYPTGITCDHAGNLYVVDQSSTIRKLAPSGTNWVVTTIAGTPNNTGAADGTNGAAQFDLPSGIAADAAGNLYVADYGNSTIRKLTPMGTNWVVTTIAGTPSVFGDFADGTNQSAQFSFPSDLVVDRVGTVFVADGGNNAIRKIVPAGTNWVVTTIAGNGSIGYVDGTNEGAVFWSPYGLAVDANDNVYVAATYNNAIRELTPMGTNWVTTTLAGAPDGSTGATDGNGTNATFNNPWGIAVNSAGTVYVADAVNHDIRKGTLTVASAPNLTISLSGPNTVLVSWPGTGYTLQTNANLATGAWAAYGGGFTTSNGTNSMTMPSPVGNLFFRLSN